MLDVMFYEVFKEEEIALRKALQDENLSWFVDFTWKTIQETKQRDLPAKTICIRTQSQIPSLWAKILDGVLTRSKGYDHLVRYRQKTQRDIPCGFLPGYCSRAVGEHAVMCMLNLLRKFKQQVRQFEVFDRNNLTGLGCLGRNVLVVGVGEIGENIVQLVQGFGMKVKGCDLIKRCNDLEYVSLHEGVFWAEVIFCALPLTKDTNNMLGYELFKKIKNKPIFINVSRGEISPLKDLKVLLDDNVLGGFACDVFSQESDLALSLRTQKETSVLDLSRRDNVIFTPHNAFNSTDALQRKAFLTIKSVQRFLKEKCFLNMVKHKIN